MVRHTSYTYFTQHQFYNVQHCLCNNKKLSCTSSLLLHNGGENCHPSWFLWKSEFFFILCSWYISWSCPHEMAILNFHCWSHLNLCPCPYFISIFKTGLPCYVTWAVFNYRFVLGFYNGVQNYTHMHTVGKYSTCYPACLPATTAENTCVHHWYNYVTAHTCPYM